MYDKLKKLVCKIIIKKSKFYWYILNDKIKKL